MYHTGIRILLSMSTIKNLPLGRIDFTFAFLQTDTAKRDVYVVPPREFRSKYFDWVLLTSAVGLFNANAKWKKHRDSVLRKLGLSQS